MVRRNRLLRHVIEGRIDGTIEVVAGRELRCKKLVYDLKEKKGYKKLKKEALDRTLCRTGFGRRYGLVVKPSAE
jgi:hypothetical protein